MKPLRIACGMSAAMLIVLQSSPASGGEAFFRPGIGIGVVAASGYKSYMQDSGAGHDTDVLLDFAVSAKFRIGDRWAAVPVGEFLATPESFTETIGFVAAALFVRHSFTPEPGIFLQAGPNYVAAQGGSVIEEFKGGLGGGASIGYAFKEGDRSRFGPEVEIGYNYYSVEASENNNGGSGHFPYGDTRTTKENFGGPFLRATWRF